MAIWSVILALDDDQRVIQYDHDAESFVRRYCTYVPTWSPAASNFDVVTGLPRPEAISSTGVSNPCSVAASLTLFYVLDMQTCRILAFDPATGSLHSTFGGRRGIGAGKIEPDGSRRSVVAIGNGKVFVTDNSGNFVLQYLAFGTFEAEYSISGWATAVSLSFDQVTGFCYDSARGVYWALAQGNATAYLVEVNLAGVPTGETIDLTARLASSLGITVGGHGGSPAERERTRGLAYFNGRLFFCSEGRVIRVDLTGTGGDQLVASLVNDVGPGSIASDGATFTHVLRDQPNGVEVVRVITLATGVVRDYALAASPPTGGSAVGGAWDVAITTAEDASGRTSRDLTLRTRISVTTPRAQQLRAAISNQVPRSTTMRAHLMSLGAGQQVPLQLRARIEEPTTIADAVARSWELTDGLGEYSRGFQLQATSRAGFQRGDTLTVYAGYDQTRVRLGQFEIDEISLQLEPDSELVDFSCRDLGSRELDSRLVTRTWEVQFPTDTDDVPSVTSATILTEAAAAAGVTLATSELPSYPLYANFAAQQESFLQIAQKLIEPWNQFPSSQYHVQVRGSEVSILRRDWRSPPSTGYPIERRHLKSLARRQQRYLQSPNLTAFDEFVVKGTTVTINILNQLGPQVRVEYARQVAEGAVTGQSAGSVGSTAFAQEWLLTETVNTEELWGDKVLTRTEEVYTTGFTGGLASPTLLSALSVEEHLYFEPAGPLGLDAIQVASAGPSPLALVYQTNSVRSGLNQDNSLFQEVMRSQTNYNYDDSSRLISEVQSETRYNSDANRWELQNVAMRFHSRTSGGTTRVGRIGLVADEGSIFLDSADAQQVGGGRVDFASTGYSVVSFQAIAPEPQVVVIAPGETAVVEPPPRAIWSYENAYLGQQECERIRELALAEKNLQVTHHWEMLDGVSVLNPQLYSGMAARIEVEAGSFENYYLESVNHSFNPDEALTRFTAKRLTSEDLP